MPDVYDWPPVLIFGSETTISRPGAMSRGLSGTPYFSQAQPTRTLITAQVHGVAHGAGYIEALKVLLDGKLPLVRLRPIPRYWLGDVRGQPLYQDGDLTWTGLSWTGLEWTSGAVTGFAGTEDGWPYLDCVDFPGSTKVVAPGARISTNGATAYATRPATTFPGGFVRIWLTSALSDGQVTIGEPLRVFHVDEWPRAVQPVAGGYSYDFKMSEVFASEYTGGFTYYNPWGT